MAYDGGDFIVSATGSIGGFEQWVNTWSFKGVETPAQEADAGQFVNNFYALISPDMSSSWQAIAATGRYPLAGVTVDLAWTTVTGTEAVELLLPTQIAVRVSLRNALGVRGGPFIAGFPANVLAAGGLLQLSTQELLADEAERIQTSAVAEGFAMGIHRPSVDQVVLADTLRVGNRFDVIRRRGNDTPEVYETRDLT